MAHLKKHSNGHLYKSVNSSHIAYISQSLYRIDFGRSIWILSLADEGLNSAITANFFQNDCFIHRIFWAIAFIKHVNY